MIARVIDSHVHFPLSDLQSVMGKRKVHPWVESERTKWRKAWQFPEPQIIGDIDEIIEKWYEETFKHDLSKVVFVTANGNENMLKIVRTHPDKFVGYAHHDPSKPDAADELEKYLKAGLSGYKILGPKVSVPLNDRKLYPVWEVAQSYNIPVLIHFGIMGGAGGIANHVNISPLIIHDVAKEFPRINFIIPHFGCGYVFETLNLCWACPNVFIDTSGSNQWIRWMPYELSLEKLFRKYYETIGPERIIFGTDSSWFPRGFSKSYFDEQYKAMVYIGMSDDEIDRVLYKNIYELLEERVI
ncbi:amidohydrolase family protein [Kosmotoga pacifica]|uniref:Amidohydrolase n=1 Tax=Kosmotoga pacifica TaxID=1330330 RepID=A0A0G2ZDF3_9BACT|nr:amidohydrolase family protein [Kosmotoga pacifica]AKI97594.1 amidohydrolase [Kosmotoga pacifica]